VAFVAELAKGVDVAWTGRLLLEERALLLDVPTGALPDGSKEVFVRLLEYAEETLRCVRVFVRFPRLSPERALLLRTFMYFGFALLAPDRVPPAIGAADCNDDSIVMLYMID